MDWLSISQISVDLWYNRPEKNIRELQKYAKKNM
jgi:hypothetical protein